MPFTITEVDAVFSAAVELPSAEQRAEYVQRICGDNAELRKRVEELLEAHFAAGQFLEQPPATLLHSSNDEVQAEPGTVIGPYKLLQQIGEGGMGVVFMAEQTAPIHRTVALKIIKPGMDTRQVIARFEAERQALAMMDHPNIAKVLDAGTTDNGRPYFVMELVKGVPVTKYCDDHKLRIRERLQLFKPICEAVQHAHQKGIIHRDLKPTNVLVAEYDNHAVPKVIDFGVAKATAQKLTERTMFTEFGQVIGTVEYMSPEQAKFNQLDIDTRSDVYSLGVLLYELLTGSTPFDRERLRDAAFDEVLRIIREEEPPKPSTRLSASGSLPLSGKVAERRSPEKSSLAHIAANRDSEPAKLNKEVRGDLDRIVMKCLEKDRNRRYETTNGLSRDIERYLHDEPVQACPPSATYRFRKFARRNKVALVVASAAIAMLLVLVAGLAISNRLIETEREQADAERRRAEQNLLRARMAITEILFEPASGRGEWSQLPKPLREKFAEKIRRFCESLLHEESTSPSLQYETAVGFRSLAVLHNGLNEFEKAEKYANQSIKILDRLTPEHMDVLEYRNQQAYSYYILGSILTHVKRKGIAEPALKRSATLYEALIAEHPDAFGCYSELSHCYDALIGLQKARGAKKEAELTVDRALALLAKVPAVPASSPVLSALAEWLSTKGRFDEAINTSRKAIELNPANSDAYGELLGILNFTGDFKGAEEAARKQIELAPNGTSYLNLGLSLGLQGKHDEAIAAFRQSIKLDPKEGEAFYSLGLSYSLMGKFDDAVSASRTAVELSPKNARYLNHLAWILATIVEPQNRNPHQAIELAQRAVDSAPAVGDYWETLGVARYRAGEWQPAIDALVKTNKLTGGTPTAWFFLAMAHRHLGDSVEAQRSFSKGVEWMDRNASQLESMRGVRAAEVESLLRFRSEATELLRVANPPLSIAPSDHPPSPKPANR